MSTVSARSKTPAYESVPKAVKTSISPITNPKSPILLTMKAFLAAAAAEFRVNQKPIRRYEQSPTSSQPMKSMAKFALLTGTPAMTP